MKAIRGKGRRYNMAGITCPNPQCGQKIQVFLVESGYQGPLRCNFCHNAFLVDIQGGKMVSSKPLSEEELTQLQEAQRIKARFRHPGTP
jgi:hypothetical protein